jgi:catechol 2,3-dioxygenase-like lactoylglutathione lyase family enzyme
MTLIPTMRCRDMRVSVAFYTGILDFQRTDDDDPAEHDFVTLGRGGGQLTLAHDGVFGTVVVVATLDVDAAFRLFQRRGLRTPGNSGCTDAGS